MRNEGPKPWCMSHRFTVSVAKLIFQGHAFMSGQPLNTCSPQVTRQPCQRIMWIPIMAALLLVKTTLTQAP